MSWMNQVLRRVKDSDPVGGVWPVSVVNNGRVWCDASSIAIGTVLEINGMAVEDAAWLRKKHDKLHINVAELEAVVHGLNLGIKWNLKNIQVITDSATVKSWMTSVLTGSHRIRTHGVTEMLIRRKLSVVSELISAYDLSLSVMLV